ncbi:26222_t:CDS:2 [Gigaspora margarita]|uniref:DNA 3'-5' helicase n=1 Tax=Gigaspora margarita TaxID=4874 RepID=A0ABN7URG3_GIGMA|nr:26222_t:CDS:2 [Gigaspora margarita]
MALTATLSYTNVKALQINLNFDITCFATIRESDLFRKELCFSVQSRKDTNLDWADKVVKLIKNMEKNNVMKKWNNSQTHLIVTTLAFGLGIDMPDVCLVIHYNFPMSMKDPIPQPCNSCDNCTMRAKDKVELKDVKTEILDLLKVVEVLCENNDKPNVSLDIIDIFSKLALADLVCHGFVNQTIWLEQKTSTAYLTSTIIIQGIVEDASSLVQEKSWLYWIKL